MEKNKTLENLYSRNDLVDVGTHVPTKEILELGYGPLNTKLNSGNWDTGDSSDSTENKGIWDKETISAKLSDADIELPNDYDSYKYYTIGLEKFLEDYKKSYGVDYEKDNEIRYNGDGEYTIGHYRILDHMDDNQRSTYLYMYGRYSKDAAQDYFSNYIVHEKGYKTRRDATNSYATGQKQAENKPLTYAVTKPLQDVIIDLANLMRMVFAEDDGVVDGESDLANIQAGRNAGLIEEWEPYIAEEGAEFAVMALSMVDDHLISNALGGGVGGNLMEGFITGTADSRMQQVLAGTAGTEGATTEMLIAGVTDAVASPLLGKSYEKLGGKLLNKLPKGSRKALAAEVAWKGLTSAGIGTTRGTIDVIANEIVMGDNSNYDIAYNNYISQGMSESEARALAIQDAYVTPIISSTISLGVLGTIRGIPGTAKKHIDFTKRGKSVSNGVRSTYEAGLRAIYGDKLSDAEIKSMAKAFAPDESISESVLKAAGKYDKNSMAAKNAELLKKYKAKHGKITMSQLGAQDILNQAEAYSFFRYADGMNKLTGVSSKLDVDMGSDLKGYYKDGTAHLSSTSEDGLKATADHEYGHGLQEGAPDAYKIYTDIIESNASYKAAFDNVVEKNKRAGNVISGKVAQAEAAAEIGRSFMPKSDEDLARLRRRVEGNTTLYDKIYEGVRFLRMKLDTARKKVFVDDATGFRATYDEVYRIEKALEDALTKVDKSKIGSGNTSYRIVENVVDSEGNYYKNAVLLDTGLFDGIKPRNWNKVLSKFVYDNIAGEKITVYKPDGTAEEISFAKDNERVTKDGAKNSRRVIDKLARTKGNVNSLAVVHIDELLQTAKELGTSTDNSHQWLDENGWEHRNTYLVDRKGQIYETTLNIAKAKDGRNILYALSNTKRVGDGAVLSAPDGEELAHNTNSYSRIISQDLPVVNSNSNNSTLNRVKNQSDVMKYGRNVQDDVDRFTSQKDLGLYKLLGDTDIAIRVKSAYDLYDAGHIEEGYSLLRQIGDDLEKKSKGKVKPGEISQKFAETFDELYTRGRDNKASSNNYREYDSDMRDIGFNVTQYTARLLAEEYASMGVSDRMITEKILREAYTELKFTGDEARARELLRPAAEKIVSRAKTLDGTEKYIDNKTEAVEGVLDRMVEHYKDEQPAARYGKEEIIAEDNRKYGKDIESVARDVSVSNLKEGDAKKIGNVIRSSIDTILGDKDYNLNDIEDGVARVIQEISTSRQLSPLEKASLAETINYEIIEAIKRDIGKRETAARTIMQEETDKLKARREAGETGELHNTPEYEEAKAELDLCESQSEKLQLMFGENKGQYKLSTPAKKAHRVVMNDETQMGFMGEVRSRLGDMVYKAMTEQETAEYGMHYVRSHDNYDTLVYLQSKAQWNRKDMGIAAALVAQFGLEGDSARAAEVFIMAQKFATEGGQTAQAMRLFYCLTPEGKIAWYMKTQQNKLSADLGKTKTPESNKALVEKLTQDMETAERDADNYLVEHDADHKRLVDTQDKLRSDIQEVANNNKQLEAELLEKQRQTEADERFKESQRKLFRKAAEIELREKARKWGVELPESKTEATQADVSDDNKFIPNRSAETERINALVRDTLAKVTELDMKNKKLDLLIEEAEARAEADFKKRTEGYSKKEVEIEKQIQENQRRMRELRRELRNLQMERDANIHQYLMVNADDNGVYVKEPSSSWFKLKKSGADKVELKTHLDSVLDELGIEHISRGDFLYFRELVGSIEDMETSDELLDLIMDMSKRRNTAQFGRTEEIRKRLSNLGYKTVGKHIESGYNALADVLNKRAVALGKPQLSAKSDDGYKIEHINLDPDSKEYNLLKSALKKVETEYGLDTLKDIATQQVFGIISDLDQRTAAGKAKTMMHIAQLLNFRTVGRNILATAGFSGVDTLTNNLAYLVEKTHNFVRGKGFTSDAMGWEPLYNKAIKEAAGKRRNMAFVEQALNVNVLNNDNARTGGPVYQRQFTKGVGASLERMLGYALYVPDESFKGAIGERVRNALDKSFMPREIDLSMVDELANKFSKSISVSGDDTTDYEGVFADVMLILKLLRKHTLLQTVQLYLIAIIKSLTERCTLLSFANYMQDTLGWMHRIAFAYGATVYGVPTVKSNHDLFEEGVYMKNNNASGNAYVFYIEKGSETNDS